MKIRRHTVSVLRGITLAVTLSLAPAATLWADLPKTTAPPATSPRMTATMMGMPLQFEANHGQVDAQVKFLARGKGYTLFLTPTESVMVLQQREATESTTDHSISGAMAMPESAPIKQSVVRMKLEGANSTPAIAGMGTLPGIVNYFIGKEPSKWRTNIPTYARVRYQEAYPGIDVVYYGNQGQLEYDFIVAPGADPNQIKLAFEGVSEIKVAESGDLLLATALGEVRLQKPVVYQIENDGHKTLVAGNYLAAPHRPKEIGFQLAAYDTARALIIDPSLFYSTFLGGSTDDVAAGITVDAAGNAYVVGSTASSDFPVTTGASKTLNPGNNYDVFVTKLNPTGSGLVYATYFGGSAHDNGYAIAVDATGNAYVTGYARSSDFPTTPGAFQTTLGSTQNAFVSKLNPTGTGLVYSTYLGGSAPSTSPLQAIVLPTEAGERIAVDAMGNAYVTGRSTSSDFPTTPGAFQTTLGGCGGQYYYTCDGFVTKLNPTGSGLVYSTYLGGAGDEASYGIAVDATGNAYVTGYTTYTLNFPTTPGAFQSSQCAYGCVFVSKLNPTGTALLYSSTFGGGPNSDQIGVGIAVDGAGNAYVTGRTITSNFPTTAGAFQPTKSSSYYDVFVTKLNPTGSALVYSTYLGGNASVNPPSGPNIAVDGAGNAYVTGTTSSFDFPTTPGAFQVTFGGGSWDAFVTKLNPTGTGLIYSSYFGGSNDDLGLGVAVDTVSTTNPNVYVTGYTNSSNFPTTTGVFKGTLGEYRAAFVVKLSDKPIAKVGADQTVPEGAVVTLDGSGSSGGSLTYTWTQVAGPTVVLNVANPVYPTFTAPAAPIGGITLTFQLAVNNGSQASFPVTANITVKHVNHPPSPNAGPAQTVGEGALVTLDGSASYDPDGDPLTFQWTQSGGPRVALSSATASKPTFTAPAVSSGSVALTFTLTVSDGSLSSTAFVSITVEHVNHPPVANAGQNQTVNDTKLVTLDGSASSDPDSDPLTYAWSQVSGPSATLSNPGAVKPTFTAPIVSASGATLVFQLAVTDPGQLSSTATTNVTAVHQSPVCSAATAKPSVLWPPNHRLIPVKIIGVTDPDNLSVTIQVTTVTSDEPVLGGDDGDMKPDAVIQGQGVLLRAERNGRNNGRVYVVTFTATDSNSGTCQGTVTVTVPHDRHSDDVDDRNARTTDDGQVNDAKQQ